MHRGISLLCLLARVWQKVNLNPGQRVMDPMPTAFATPAGGTYPVDKEAEAEFLRALEEPGGVGAGVIGEPGTRHLSSVASPVFLESSLVGFAQS